MPLIKLEREGLGRGWVLLVYSSNFSLLYPEELAELVNETTWEKGAHYKYCCFVLAWLSGLLSAQTCCYVPPSALHLHLTKPLDPPSPLMTEELPPVALCQADGRKAILIFQFAKADIVQHVQKCSRSRLVEKAQDSLPEGCVKIHI